MSLSVTEQERLATLDECISTCEEAVGLLSAVASPGTKDKLPARERAKVDAACAYTANALYFGALRPLQRAVLRSAASGLTTARPAARRRRPAAAAYMNTQGVDPKGHPVMEQLVRGARCQRRSCGPTQPPRRAAPCASPRPRSRPFGPFPHTQRLVKEMQSKISQRVRAASPAACPPPHTLTRCPRAACGERHQDSGGTGSGNAPQRSLALDREAAARLVRHAQGSGRQGGGARS